MKQRICRAGLPAVSAISTCGNTGEGKLLRPLRGLPRQHLQVQLVLLAGRQTPPTPRRTARIPRPCGPTSSIDDLALPISRTDLAGWVFPTRVLLTKSDAKQRAAAATRLAPRSGGQQLGVDAGQCLGTGALLLVYSPIVADRDGDRLADVGDRGVGQPGVRGVAGHPGRLPPGLPRPAGHRAAAVRRRLGWWSCSDDAIHPVRSAGRGARLPRFVPLSRAHGADA